MFGYFTRRYVDAQAEQIAGLREQVDYHTKRADRALDVIASLRTGVPVTTALPAYPSVTVDMTRKLAEMAENPEFAHVGEMAE